MCVAFLLILPVTVVHCKLGVSWAQSLNSSQIRIVFPALAITVTEEQSLFSF